MSRARGRVPVSSLCVVATSTTLARDQSILGAVWTSQYWTISTGTSKYSTGTSKYWDQSIPETVDTQYNKYRDQSLGPTIQYETNQCNYFGTRQYWGHAGSSHT